MVDELHVEYAALDGALDYLGAGIDAAECHGLLVGWLMSSPSTDQGPPTELTSETWVASVLEGSAAQLEENAPDDRSTWALAVLAQAWTRANATLSDDTFAPVLPDDGRPMGLRARAVGSWCAGFLSGLGQGGLLANTELSPDADEFIRDLVEITRIEPSPQDDEGSESALVELVEYIRAGVMTVGEDLGQVAKACSPEKGHRIH